MTRWLKTPCADSACVEVGKEAPNKYKIRNSMFRADQVQASGPQIRALVRAAKLGILDELVEPIR